MHHSEHSHKMRDQRATLQVVQFLLEMCDVPIDAPIVRRQVDDDADETDAGSPPTVDVRTTALAAACEHARADTVRYLLSNGAGHVRRAPADQSTLCAAIAGGAWEIVSMILSRGVDVAAERDQFGRPVAVVAAKYGHQHVGILELLLSRGECS